MINYSKDKQKKIVPVLSDFPLHYISTNRQSLLGIVKIEGKRIENHCYILYRKTYPQNTKLIIEDRNFPGPQFGHTQIYK